MMSEEEDEEMATPIDTMPDHQMTKFTFDTNYFPRESHRFSNRLGNALINTRCSDQCKFTLSAFLGILAVLMQIPPLFMLNWIQIQEPKAVNQTDDQGEFLEAPFLFDLGYFQVCREPSDNMTDFKPVDPIKVRQNFPRLCVTNPVFTGEDLSDYSFASAIILSRLLVPAILQIIGCFLGAAALFLSFVGQFRYNKQSLMSSIFYIISGLFIFVAVLQFICAVDDEMNFRMKPNLAGEPTKFNFRYVSEMIARSRKGFPPSISSSSHRRDSRCSREVAFGGIHQEVQRLAPPLTESLSVKPAIHFCI